MRKPPGQRGGWAPAEPAEVSVLTAPSALPGAPLPARPRPASEAGRNPVFPPTRPATEFQATLPFNDFQATRAAGAGQPARRPDAPAARAPAAAPAPPRRPAAAQPNLTAPSSEGHWHVRGSTGQNLVLMPGQMHMGQQVASLRTLLGSCVAITLWHPTRRIGGMCHFLLPQRKRLNGEPADGRYGDEAVAEMVKVLTALGTQPQEYVAHLYGGADTMSGVSAARFNIGERNIEQGWSLIDRYGFQLDGVDVGEDIPRSVALTLATGVVTMRRGTGQAPDHLRS